jgi:hypothetical protein
MAKKMLICINCYENPQIVEGKPTNNKFLDAKMNLQIIKTVNSKPADSKGILYLGEKKNGNLPKNIAKFQQNMVKLIFLGHEEGKKSMIIHLDKPEMCNFYKEDFPRSRHLPKKIFQHQWHQG